MSVLWAARGHWAVEGVFMEDSFRVDQGDRPSPTLLVSMGRDFP